MLSRLSQYAMLLPLLLSHTPLCMCIFLLQYYTNFSLTISFLLSLRSDILVRLDRVMGKLVVMRGEVFLI